MKRAARTLAALAIAAGATLTATPANADAQGCTGWVTKDTRHTRGIHCMGGPGSEYRAAVEFCGPTGCWWGYGGWKDYGADGKSWAHSDYGTAVGSGGIILYR